MDAVTSRSYSRPIWISWDSLTSDNCFAPVAGFVAHAAVHAARRPAVTRSARGRGRGRGREASMGALLSIDDGSVRYTDGAGCKPKAARRDAARSALKDGGAPASFRTRWGRGRPSGRPTIHGGTHQALFQHRCTV